MQPVAISEQTLHILETLEPGQSLEKKVGKLAEQELLRRLARYQLTDYTLRHKYGLTLEEFEAEVSYRNEDILSTWNPIIRIGIWRWME